MHSVKGAQEETDSAESAHSATVPSSDAPHLCSALLETLTCAVDSVMLQSAWPTLYWRRRRETFSLSLTWFIILENGGALNGDLDGAYASVG